MFKLENLTPEEQAVYLRVSEGMPAALLAMYQDTIVEAKFVGIDIATIEANYVIAKLNKTVDEYAAKFLNKGD